MDQVAARKGRRRVHSGERWRRPKDEEEKATSLESALGVVVI